VQTFENFFFEQYVIPVVLTVNIHDVGELKAKADTGNDGHNVLHATDITSNGSTVTFTCNGNVINRKSGDQLQVRKGPKISENRPIVNFNITINGKTYNNIPFTVTDRTGMSTPVLLGKDFIAKMGAVVDPTPQEALHN